MIKGVFGRYLDVDLTTGKTGDYEIPPDWYEKHLGGRGIAARIMLKELKGKEDPLGEDNILIFATGPLQGTNVAGAGRYLVMSRSPKTGTMNEAYAGGFWGHELGRSGYDGIIVRGRAEEPKYISLINGKVRIHDAQNLWGLATAETERILEDKYRGARVTSIGQAGEKLIPFSCIINDRNRSAGRPGFGAVMGSKKLKAIVVKGSQQKEIFKKEEFTRLRRKFSNELLKDPKMGDWGKLGTTGTVTALNELGILPTKNFQEGEFEAADKTGGEELERTILTRRDTCPGCPVRCKRVCKGTFMGEEILEEYGGPEYETMAAFGSLCLNSSLPGITLLNQKCNQYGLDTISTGNLIAFAMEATERGLLKPGIKWGDAEAMVRLVDEMIEGKGLGHYLAKGLVAVAKEIGGEEFAVHIKGQEVPLHEPRGKKSMGISYATSPRGATHMETVHDSQFEVDNSTPDIGVKVGVPGASWKNKPGYCKIYEDLCSFSNSLIICAFTSSIRIERGGFYAPGMVRELVNLLTGMNIDAQEMLRIGERNYVIRRLMTAKDGYTTDDDDLPQRLKEPLKKGVLDGEEIPDETLREMISEYYRLRGFNKYGPTDRKLAELGLEDLKGHLPK